MIIFGLQTQKVVKKKGTRQNLNFKPVQPTPTVISNVASFQQITTHQRKDFSTHIPFEFMILLYFIKISPSQHNLATFHEFRAVNYRKIGLKNVFCSFLAYFVIFFIFFVNLKISRKRTACLINVKLRIMRKRNQYYHFWKYQVLYQAKSENNLPKALTQINVHISRTVGPFASSHCD